MKAIDNLENCCLMKRSVSEGEEKLRRWMEVNKMSSSRYEAKRGEEKCVP
jgi:hypothetical protein